MNWLTLFILHLIGNGHGQSPQLNCSFPLDLVYIIPQTTDVDQSEFDLVVDFLQTISNQLDVDSGSVQIAVVKYNNHASIEFDFNDHTTNAAVNTTLAALTDAESNHANLTPAIWATEMLVNGGATTGSRFGVLKMVMLIFDESDHIHNTANTLQRLKDDGVTIMTIGIGDNVNTAELKAIATDPSLAFTVVDYNYLVPTIIVNTLQEFMACPPTSSPSLSPSASPTQSPSISPSLTPSSFPSISPTQPPSNAPSLTPSSSPTQSPSISPSLTPSSFPSISPTQPPSNAPSLTPSSSPTQSPSTSPSLSPTQPPTLSPSIIPSSSPTQSPSLTPSIIPSLSPTQPPSFSPSLTPTQSPSVSPSLIPTQVPSLNPSIAPSLFPSMVPTQPPSLYPSLNPSNSPSNTPVSIIKSI
eukprot:69160_1